MSIAGLVTLLVWVLVICLVAWLAFWIMQQFNPPDPVGKIARVVIVVVCVVLLIVVLMQVVGGLPRLVPIT